MTNNSKMTPIPLNIRCRTESLSRPKREAKVFTAEVSCRMNCFTDPTLKRSVQSLVRAYFVDELATEEAVKIRICRRHFGSKLVAVYVFDNLHSRLRKLGHALCLGGCRKFARGVAGKLRRFDKHRFIFSRQFIEIIARHKENGGIINMASKGQIFL